MSEQQLTPGQAAIIEGTFDMPATSATPSPQGENVSIQQLDDQQLAHLISLLLQEQQERAVRDADPEALTIDGFNRMFTSKGAAEEPVLVDGILVCAGSLRNLSQSSHICSFVHVDEYWCWDHPDLINDEVRKIPNKGKEHQRSITLVPVTEGTEIDFVTCKLTARDGHRATSSTSYTVVNGQLEVTDTRTAPKPGHGR